MTLSSPMPAALHVMLTPEEDRTLAELRLAKNVGQRTRDRAHMIRLNDQGWTAPAIAEIFQCQEQTVRATLHRWQRFGLGGLWDAPGRGTKPKWQEADLVYLETCLEGEPRTYNSSQLASTLEQVRQVQLSPDRIRRLLKKRASDGKEHGTVNKVNKTLSINNSNKLI